MQNTSKEYDAIVSSCRDLFSKKMKDYGCAWRILRLPSLTDQIFIKAGCTWGEAGCSMCVGMNGDIVAPQKRCASTSNRNFVGRQGSGSRTHLMSPAMAAAAAINGRLTDVREL